MLLLRALTRSPLPLLYGLGWVIYFIGFRLMHWRRAQAQRDIDNALPERSAVERTTILRQTYRNTADVMAEAFWGYGASREALAQRVTIANPEVVQRYAGMSVVLLTAHYANWEWLLLAAGVHFGVPIDVVYQPQRVESIDRFLRDARSRFGSKLIPRKEFIFELMSRADQPRTYALIADQTPRKTDPKHWTRFLGQDTAFFTGAGKIAKFLDAPVIYVAMERLRRGHYVVRFELLAEPPLAEGEDALLVERYAATLEREIRASPADWLWLQKKWKYQKSEASEPAPRRRAAAR